MSGPNPEATGFTGGPSLILLVLISSLKGNELAQLEKKLKDSKFVVYHDKSQKLTMFLKQTPSEKLTLNAVMSLTSITPHPHFLLIHKKGWSSYRVKNGVVVITLNGKREEIKTSVFLKAMKTTHAQLFGKLNDKKKIAK